MIQLIERLVQDYYIRFDLDQRVIFVQHANDELPKSTIQEIKNYNCTISSTSQIEPSKYLTVVGEIRDYRHLKY